MTKPALGSLLAALATALWALVGGLLLATGVLDPDVAALVGTNAPPVVLATTAVVLRLMERRTERLAAKAGSVSGE